MIKDIAKAASVFLLCASAISLIGLEWHVVGWVLLFVCAASLLVTEKSFSKDLLLLIIAIFIFGITPINTDTSAVHIVFMSVTLAAAVLLPYFISRHIYKENAVRFPWHHGRYWYFSEIIYIAVTACVAYFLLPYYLRSTGAYLNWPSASDMGSLVRLFIGTNALGFWDELFFVSTALGIMRRHFSFAAANIFQSVLFTSFLYDLGFKGWGFVMIFLFALLQGYIFKRTDSLLYVVTIHLTLDCILFLALINAYHPMIIPIFISG